MKTYKYQKVESKIRKQIKKGMFKEGDILPSESEMCDIFNVSRVTVRKAIENLVLDGTLIRRRGIGTYVNDNRFISYSGDKSFSQEMIDNGKEPGSKILEYSLVNVKENDDIKHELNLKTDEKYYYVSRIRTADNLIIAISHSYLPYDLFKNLTAEALEKHSLFAFIGDLYEINHSHKGLTKITAVMPDKKQKNILNIANEPLLKVTSKSSLKNSRIFEYTITYYIGSRFAYMK